MSLFTRALNLGLWSIWLSGFFLICISLCATQLLNCLNVDFKDPTTFNEDGVGVVKNKGNPSITIFSVPTICNNGSIGEDFNLAVRSWLGLSSNINVVLFGNDPFLHSLSTSFGPRVSIESNIDFSFLENPFFHSIVARAEASLSDISVLIHPQTILLPDFLSTLNHVYELNHDWFLVASSRRVSSLPFRLDDTGRDWLREDGRPIRLQKEVISETGHWDNCSETMLMAWNTGEIPLHMGVLPPFLYGKGVHNHWFINEIYHSNYRFVFDASLAMTSIFIHEMDDHKPIQSPGISTLPGSEKTNWESQGNHHIGESYGLFASHKSNISNLVKLVKCDGQLMFTVKDHNIVYSPLPNANSYWKEQIMQSRRQNKIMGCLSSLNSRDTISDCSLITRSGNVSTPLSLPFGLDDLLSKVSDENKTVVLSISGYSYKDMLMSWVCRLRHLNAENFLVCALDDETYEFSILQGLPVFRDPWAPTNISYNDCHFGTKCFQKVTKSKSRIVLQILKLRYNVLMSDVDIYWFKNPLPLLQTFGPAVLVAQSDEFNVTVPINLPRRLNSGFYFARSDDPTISALEKVVKHAMISELSEQPSFYDTLCGQGGSNRLGVDKCLEPETNLTVQFLDRDLFPNGAYQGLWEKIDVRAACEERDCYVLHNNWVRGRMKKLERQVNSGLWDYDMSSRMCFRSWHRLKDISFA